MLPFNSNGFQRRKARQLAALTNGGSTTTTAIPPGIYLPFVVSSLEGEYIRDWVKRPSLRGAGTLSEIQRCSISKSSSGNYVVLAQGRKVIVQHTGTKEIIREVLLPNAIPSSCTDARAAKLSHDDQYLFIVLSASPWYKIFRVNDGADVSNLLLPVGSRPTASVTGFDFNPVNGDLALIRSSGSNNLTIFDSNFQLKTPQPTSLAVGSTGSVKYSPDGSLLAATGSNTIPVRLYNVTNYQLDPTPAFSGTVITGHQIEWSSNSQKVLTTKTFNATTSPFSIYEWDRLSNTTTALIGINLNQGSTGGIKYIKNQSVVMIGNGNVGQSPRFFDPLTWIEVPSSTRVANLVGNNVLTFIETLNAGSINSDSVLTEAGDRGMCEFEYLQYSNMENIYLATPYNLAPEALSVDRNLTKIAFGNGRANAGKYAIIFDSRTGDKLCHVKKPIISGVGGVLGVRPILSPDGSEFVFCSPGASSTTALSVYNSETGAVLADLQLPSIPVAVDPNWSRQHSYSPDGRYIIVLYWNGLTASGTARLWLATYDTLNNYELINSFSWPLGIYAQRFYINPYNGNIVVDTIGPSRNKPIVYDDSINMNVLIDYQLDTLVVTNQAGQWIEGGRKLLLGDRLYDADSSYIFTETYSELLGNNFQNTSTGVPFPDGYNANLTFFDNFAPANAGRDKLLIDPRTRTNNVIRTLTETNHAFSNLTMRNKNVQVSDLHIY